MFLSYSEYVVIVVGSSWSMKPLRDQPRFYIISYFGFFPWERLKFHLLPFNQLTASRHEPVLLHTYSRKLQTFNCNCNAFF